MVHNQDLSLSAQRCLAGSNRFLPPVWYCLHTLAHQAEASHCAIGGHPSAQFGCF